MTIDALPHQNLIDDKDLSISYEYKIFETTLGDGYRQLAPNGINNEVRTVTLTYKNLRVTEYNDVIQFIRALKGVKPVYYTLPGETQSVWTVNPNFTSTQIAISGEKIIRSITITLRNYYSY